MAYQRYRRARRRMRSPQSVVDGRHAVVVRRAVTIHAAPPELYQLWRRLDNLPHIMRHLEAVTETSPTRSRWVAKGPGGAHVAWEAEIIRDVPNECIAWRSVDGSLGVASVMHAGSVRFRPAPHGRGTEVHVEMSYEAPGGVVAAAVAQVFGQGPDVEIREDLRRFKQSVEAGEVATGDRRPTGGG